jgi:hypothetical protein
MSTVLGQELQLATLSNDDGDHGKNVPTNEAGQGVVATAPAVGDNNINAQFEGEMEMHNDNPMARNYVVVDVACENELQLYNNLPQLQIQKGSNPLDWWKSLPTLAAIARSYLHQKEFQHSIRSHHRIEKQFGS